MPPKRKAASDAPSNHASKRPTPRPATPRSSDSDEYVDEDLEATDSDAENISKAVHKFAIQNKAKIQSSRSGVTDFSYLELKPDHEQRPLWINPDKGIIVVESFSPFAAAVQDFLTTIAEPLSRPTYMWEYALTAHSLYAAVSVGLDPRDIIDTLNTFSKTPIPPSVRDFINECTQSYGKVKLVLKHNRFFVETSDTDVLQKLLQDPIIGPERIEGSIVTARAPIKGGVIIPGTKEAKQLANQQIHGVAVQPALETPPNDGMVSTLRVEDDEEEMLDIIHNFEIPNSSVEVVQKRCLELGYPILEEYDFKNDDVNPDLEIDLKPNTLIRDYQEKSLSKMFANSRAKSGIIVLPCGAGKTLVGITAACTIRKGTVILCTSSMSVVQWRNEFLKWSDISPNDIATFTSDHKEKFTRKTGIIVSTYSMVTQTRNRSYDAQKMMDFIQSREWGLMILDEVHVVPAAIFRKVTHSIATHSKLGLTATLLREDDKIRDLNFLIGPKLYEANWMELAEQGHIAKVQCAEVWCPMTTEFYQEYLHVASAKKRALFYIMNPRKFQSCQYLIDFHEKRGDKIIVFSDNVYALEMYAKKLGKCYIYGGTSQQERLRILENFQHNDQVNTIFLSKIGDTSLDLPEATCLIQISSHYGSRRQEAQRLGRILRAKRRNDEGFNAFFYSLVSKDTQEMYYSSKRQAFLVDQGYAFKVITQLQGMEQMSDLAFTTSQERMELLLDVIQQNETAGEIEKIDGDLFSGSGSSSFVGRKKKGFITGAGSKRSAAMLSDLSGGSNMAYIEYNKNKNKELKNKGGHNPLFKKMAREQAKRRAARLEEFRK